jgi:hypothetical protein
MPNTLLDSDRDAALAGKRSGFTDPIVRLSEEARREAVGGLLIIGTTNCATYTGQTSVDGTCVCCC